MPVVNVPNPTPGPPEPDDELVTPGVPPASTHYIPPYCLPGDIPSGLITDSTGALIADANLALATRLDADVHVLEGSDPIAAIIRFARDERVTQIFVGHSAPDRWKEMWSRSPVDRLIRAATDIDVRIFPHPQTP